MLLDSGMRQNDGFFECSPIQNYYLGLTIMQVLLVDGFNLVRRLYEARPHEDAGDEQKLIENISHSLHRALNRHKPSHVCCIFDSHTRTWRHQMFPDYKANRKPTPEPLVTIIPRIESALLELGVVSVCVPDYEADDVIATIAVGAGRAGARVTILSTDKNFLQLLDKHIIVYDHFKDQDFSPDRVLEKYGVRHDQLIDYWSLTGDTTVNVKGVPKIGPKTAQQLIGSGGSLDALLENPPPGTAGDRLRQYRQEAELCKQLVRLKTDVNVGINLNQLRYIPARRV